jgi:large subunit ribosomal protein L28
LFVKKFYLAEEGVWVQLKISAAGLRTVNKIGIEKALSKAANSGVLF